MASPPRPLGPLGARFLQEAAALVALHQGKPARQPKERTPKEEQIPVPPAFRRPGGRKKIRHTDYLEPLRTDKKEIPFLTFDIESKHHDTQRAGFTRPFLTGVYDPDKGPERGFHAFRNAPHLARRPWRGRHNLPGGCIDQALRVILQPEYAGFRIYTHYGGGFDYLFLPEWLVAHDDEFKFEIVPVQSSIQVLRVWRLPEDPDVKVTEYWDFLDSHKLLPLTLQKAAITFGFEGKVDHDLHLPEDDPRWDLYHKQDCLQLAAIVRATYTFVAEFGGEVGIITASTSMNVFRREYLGHHGTADKVPRHRHWNECKDKGTPQAPGACPGCFHVWIRTGYYGGRTEMIRAWGVNLHYYDINSSYVHAMRQDQPCGRRFVERGRLNGRKKPGHPSTWTRWRSAWHPTASSAGWAECTVYIPPTCPIPPLPYKAAGDTKLRFPAGRFSGVWSLEELALLYDPLVGGEIVEVKKTIWIALHPLTSQMMVDLWAHRDPTRPGFSDGKGALAKLLGNSLYGKFGMRPERTTIVRAQKREALEAQCCELCGEPTTHPTDALCSACTGSTPAGHNEEGHIWYQTSVTDAPYIIPHLAAHITALARRRLWDFLALVMRTPGPVEPIASLVAHDVFFYRWTDAEARPPTPAPWVKGTGGGVPTPSLITRCDHRNGMSSLTLKHLETGAVRDVQVPSRMLVVTGGRNYYCDTDSIVTNVELPAVTAEDVNAGKLGVSKKLLGQMKDEYPGELINFFSRQPKVYLLQKVRHNQRVALAREQETAYLAGEGTNAERAAFEARWTKAWAAREAVEAWASLPVAQRRATPEPDLEKLDPLVCEPYEKVTMKGFPPKMKTRANLEKLHGGPIDFAALARGELPTGEGAVLSWTQLEKVRSLAQRGFLDPPRMKEGDSDPQRKFRAVSKSFRSTYDKRLLLPDRSGRTVPKWVEEQALEEAAE